MYANIYMFHPSPSAFAFAQCCSHVFTYTHAHMHTCTRAYIHRHRHALSHCYCNYGLPSDLSGLDFWTCKYLHLLCILDNSAGTIYYVILYIIMLACAVGFYWIDWALEVMVVDRDQCHCILCRD